MKDRPVLKKMVSEEFNNANAKTLKTVENKIREQNNTSPTQAQQSLKRFKQLQEYLKMAHRDVKMTKTNKNESKRIVKGEIPLGTDTKIPHEIRESYPSIIEIMKRLKGCLSIKCDFDEVLKYAKEYLGIDTDERSVKHKVLEAHRKHKQKQANDKEPSIKLYKGKSPTLKRDIDCRSVLSQNQSEYAIKTVRQDIRSNVDDDEIDRMTEVGLTNQSFTKRKWDNIDELIDVLKEEIDAAKSQNQQVL
jgi:hypothetical protein